MQPAPVRCLPRRAFVFATAATLAGCAAKPVVLDRQSMASVKTVALPTIGVPSRPNVAVINAISAQFGLIGAIAGATVRNNRMDALNAMLSAQSLNVQTVLQTAVTRRLSDRGLTVLPASADPARHAFLPAYPSAATQDAVLDAFVQAYGFVALSDADLEPYRPTASVAVRLVDSRDGSILMQDIVYISAPTAPVLAPDGRDLGSNSFATFTEIEANPARAVASLRAALMAAADGIGARLA